MLAAALTVAAIAGQATAGGAFLYLRVGWRLAAQSNRTDGGPSSHSEMSVTEQREKAVRAVIGDGRTVGEVARDPLMRGA